MKIELNTKLFIYENALEIVVCDDHHFFQGEMIKQPLVHINSNIFQFTNSLTACLHMYSGRSAIPLTHYGLSTLNGLVAASSGSGLHLVRIRPSAKTSSESPMSHQLEPQGHFSMKCLRNLKEHKLRFQVSCVTKCCVYILPMYSWRSVATWAALFLLMPWCQSTWPTTSTAPTKYLLHWISFICQSLSLYLTAFKSCFA